MNYIMNKKIQKNYFFKSVIIRIYKQAVPHTSLQIMSIFFLQRFKIIVKFFYDRIPQFIVAYPFFKSYFQLTHCNLQGLLCDLGQTFQLSPRVESAEGRTVGEKCPGIQRKCRLPRYIYGSFTRRKATTWDRRLYFPSEGRRAEDFFALKIRRLRPGANLRTWVPKASPLPLDHRSRVAYPYATKFLNNV